MNLNDHLWLELFGGITGLLSLLVLMLSMMIDDKVAKARQEGYELGKLEAETGGEIYDKARTEEKKRIIEVVESMRSGLDPSNNDPETTCNPTCHASGQLTEIDLIIDRLTQE